MVKNTKKQRREISNKHLGALSIAFLFTCLFCITLISAENNETLGVEYPLTISTNHCYGLCFWVKDNPITLTKVEQHASNDAPELKVLDSTFDILTTAAFVGTNASLNYALSANTHYCVCGNNTGAGNYNMYYNNSFAPSYNISGTYINWSEGFSGTGTSVTSAYSIVSIYYAIFSVTLNSPADDTQKISGSSFTFNVSASSSGYDLINASLYINDVYNDTINWTGLSNETTFTKVFSTEGNYNWSVYACNNQTSCVWSDTNNFTVSGTYEENDLNYNTTGYETDMESFIFNITTNGSAPTNYYLNYNGTAYATSISNEAGNTYLLSKEITVPLIAGNKSFYFSFDLEGSSYESTKYNQTIEHMIFGLCNASLSTPYINFTFKDESDSSILNNVTIPLLSLTYYLGDGSIENNFTFINNTGNIEYDFCFTPNNRTVYVDYTLQYEDEAGDYLQRTYENIESLINTTTHRVLYLLKSADGIYVTFQVINTAEQPIANTHVIATRSIDGEDVNVGEGDTGADGGITFWLNPNFVHTLNFSATGYEEYITSLTPTQSTYTITIGTLDVNPDDDYTRGISYTIEPQNTTLFNNTIYDFEFVLTSNYWEISEFGFVLFNSSGDEVASDTQVTNGGTSSVNYNVGNSTSYISMDYFYVIDGNYTNLTRSWNILSSAGTDWSIKHFFDDITTYIDTGLFGLDNFGKAMIIFIIIFTFTGIMSYKFGLVSPAGISSLIFGLVLFFDVGLGLMDNLNPVGAVPHFPTVFMSIVLAGILFKEVFK